MAIPVVAAQEAAELESGGTTVTVSKPASTAQNDLLFFLHGTDGTHILTEPTGSTSIDAQNNFSVSAEVSWKLAGASEPASYSAGTDSNEDHILFALRMVGFDPAAPIHDFAANTGLDASPTCPSVTTTKANCLILRCYVCNGPRLVIEDTAYPAGTTGVFNRETEIGGISAGIAYEGQAAAGASGSAVFSLDQSDRWVAWTIAISESPGGTVSTEGAALHHHLQRLGAR